MTNPRTLREILNAYADYQMYSKGYIGRQKGMLNSVEAIQAIRELVPKKEKFVEEDGMLDRIVNVGIRARNEAIDQMHKNLGV